MYDQDIIEKKPASPITTSLLIVAAVSLIGAMVLSGIQIQRYKVAGADSAIDSADQWKGTESRKADKKAKELLGDDYPKGQ